MVFFAVDMTMSARWLIAIWWLIESDGGFASEAIRSDCLISHHRWLNSHLMDDSI